MKKLSILSFGLMILSFALTAQPQPVGHLTVFSESGDKFFLILNGEKQNNVAQTNIRVEDLTNDYYNAKIIFEDAKLPEIAKNYLAIADANGLKQDVTYKIKKDANNGKVTLKYFSATPVVQGYVPPANVYVMHYGAPVQTGTAVTGGTTITQTTTTTTAGGNTVGANINIEGINMGVSITDPTMSGSVTQTTTTTTSHSTTVVEDNHPTPVGCVNSYAMGGSDFSSAIGTINNQGFEESKLKTAKQIASSNCLSTGQIVEVCKTFGFEESKLDFAKFAYDHCTDRKNYFNVNNVFGFSSSSDDLNEYVQGRQ